MSTDTVTIAAFAGSLRKGSFNRMLLRNAVALAPADVRVDAIDIDDVPLFNADIESPPPHAVVRMRDTIRNADALLVVTPEYNFSMSGTTKNALDWASRPADDSCLNDKPVGMAGCSTGRFGGARAKLALLPVFVFNSMHVLDDPMVNVARANTKFNAEGELIDDEIKDEMRELLSALAAFARRLQKGKTAP
jgi:chromate reductase